VVNRSVISFQLFQEGTAIVVSPLIADENQVDAIRSLSSEEYYMFKFITHKNGDCPS
jgi:hypothetical protein